MALTPEAFEEGFDFLVGGDRSGIGKAFPEISDDFLAPGFRQGLEGRGNAIELSHAGIIAGCGRIPNMEVGAGAGERHSGGNGVYA